MQPNYRRCVSCREIAHKQQLWRIVREYETQMIQLDTGMGRSAYLCPTRACLQVAQKRKQLSRALRAPVKENIYVVLAQRLGN